MNFLHNTDKHSWLTPINLKNGVVLPHRLMPGPMLGVMSPLFFKVMNELNLADYWITPFIGLSTAPPKVSILRKNLKHHLESDKPFIVQLLGNNPKVLVKACKQLSQLNITGININFACPSNTVLSSNSGAKLLTHPEKMVEIIETIREEFPNFSISLKVRIGLSSPEEFKDFMPILCKTDVDFIMLHFRTAEEKYFQINNGPERIKDTIKLVTTSKIPIIASGDIFSLDNAENMYSCSKCHGITVARGLFEDPFLIRKIEAKLSNNPMHITGNSKIVFSKKLASISDKTPELYNRSNFLGLMRSIWGSNHKHFHTCKSLPDTKVISYFKKI
jgi:tRNA-dihydrouridine synthase C